jgi:hypothetical protein
MKIQVLDPESTTGLLIKNGFFRDIFDYFATLAKDEDIEWVCKDGKILAVCNRDLESFNEIPWQDINLIAAETCQQIYDLSYKLDYTKAYIFVTESWVEPESLKEKFYGLPLIAHYAVFNEVFNYGQELFSPKSHMSALEIPKQSPDYDFFCLIGRPSKLRHRFVYELVKQDLSQSLIKYNGNVIGNSGAPSQFDRLDYRNGFFGSDYHYGMSTPSKIIQASLYNNFKLEVQFETDSCNGQGWDLVEYHVTEKTLKPLIMGKPCLMFGPLGYHAWLSQFGIDLGHDNFTTDFDSIKSDSDRASAVVKLLEKIDFDKIQSSQEQKDKNLLGMHQLCNLSKTNILDLYRRIRAL